MMRFQAGIIDIFRHSPQGCLDGWLQRGIFPGQAAKRPFKTGSEDEFIHHLWTIVTFMLTTIQNGTSG
jgi:hypothetical protein